MRYVLREFEASARRLVDFDKCGNIHKSGSVLGMQRHYGWKPNGQVRLGSWIYNIGPEAVEKLNKAGILRGHS